MKVEQNGSNGRVIKKEDNEYSDEDVPLSRKRISKNKSYAQSDGSDEESLPLSKKIKKAAPSSDEEDVPLSKKFKTPKKERKSNLDKPQSVKRESKTPKTPSSVNDKKSITTPKSAKKKEEEEAQNVWRWWEEEKKDSSHKWTYLEHKGPVFAQAYEKLPDSVKFYYNGQPIKLSNEAEEVAGFYARMLDHDYTQKDVFNNNFFKDWQSVMTESERRTIRDLSKCNFQELFDFYKQQSEERKAMSKEEKLKIKESNAAIQAEYGVCVLDGHNQKIGNFRVEPPGLFRGRGSHPKMGMLKKRIRPEDVIINCSKDSPIPKPPPGHKWKEVRHDNTVTWLCCWIENIQNNFKYVMLNASSRLKAEKDWKKFETARKLHAIVDKIRSDYREDFKHKEMRVRQRAVALYFIDKLALRAGNEKDEDEADTVGCCSLRFEHIKLFEQKDDKEFVVEFDFLGKDSIRYQNSVQVPKRVFKNLQLFMQNKQDGDDLFDRLNTSIMNQYLRDLMEGLTAKVFRTYNASKTLEEQLELLTNPEDPVHEKILSYNRANRAVAVLCNHQRSVPKTFAKSMENLQKKIDSKKEQITELTNQAKDIKSDYKVAKSAAKKIQYEKLKKRIVTMKEQLMKLQIQATDRDENKEIALGTSKLNYLDPRISVAWCRKYNVPLEKIFNKTHREKFQWAIDMATADYQFRDITSDTKTNHMKEEDCDEDCEEDQD